MRTKSILLPLVAAMLIATAAHAQTASKGDRLAQVQRLHQQWDSLTPEQQQQVKEQIRAQLKQRYDSASPEEQARIRARLQQWPDHNGNAPSMDDNNK